MKKQNDRRINNFIFQKEEAMRDIYQIKEDFNKVTSNNNANINPKELYKYVSGVEAISDIVHTDVLMLFVGVLYSIRDMLYEEKLNQENFYIDFEDGVKLKVPFLMKKGMGTPLYYLDLGKHNLKFYKKIKTMINEEGIEIDWRLFDEALLDKDPRRINISQQTFLTGYALGFLFKNKNMDFEKFYELAKDEYDKIHKKHEK